MENAELEEMIWKFLQDADCIQDLSIWKMDNEQIKAFIHDWVSVEMASNSSLEGSGSNKTKKRSHKTFEDEKCYN